jgi:prepilin-type N-terminal cleavage/methylation domain-containing protein
MLNKQKGFTLSELLVSLAVLGLIAAFAVPKVLTSVGNSTLLANAKEAISIITGALDSFKADNNGMLPTITSLNTATGLMSKVNYVQYGTYTRVNTAETPDTFVAAAVPTAGSEAVRFSSGLIIAFNPLDNFTFTAAGAITHGRVVFEIDPDGTGPNKGISAVLGDDGRVFLPNNATLTNVPYNSYGTGGTERAIMAGTETGYNATPFAAAGLITTVS